MAADGPGALVLGANYRALGVVRSLGRQGIPVRVAKSDKHRLAVWSRYCTQALDWTASGDDAQLEQLEHIADAYGLRGWTVWPTDDFAAVLLSRHRDRLRERFVVASPSWDVMRWAWNKRLTHELGNRVGVEGPRAWFPHGAEELDDLDVAFPAVVKPAVKAEINEFTRQKAWPVRDIDELRRRYGAARRLVSADAIMLQELVPGGGAAQLSFAALAEDGRIIAPITARRTRQHPMSFGHASTFVESIVDDDVADRGRRIIEGMRCTGLVEVEFKRDPVDGRAKLLDINVRVWGWHTLGNRAGVDFPYLYWRLLHGETVPELHGRPGVRWVRLTTDLPTAGSEILAGRLGLGRFLADVRPPCEHATLAADDPLPGLLDAPLIASLATRQSLQASRVRRLARRAYAAKGASRILVLVQNSSVPVDRRVWNEVSALREAGYEVSVICPAGTERDRATYEVIDGVEIHRFEQAEAGGGALSYLREYIPAFVRMRALVRRLARRQRFDVVHAANPPDFLLFTALSLKRQGTRFIFDHHDLSPELYEARFERAGGLLLGLTKLLERANFRTADVVLVPNESYKRIAIERGHMQPEDVFVVRSGPRLSRFTPLDPDPGLRRGRDHLLVYIGEMARQDGIDHAVRALALLRRRRSDWHAVFAGEGAAQPDLERLTDQLGLNGDVEFPGWLHDRELRTLLSSADVCLVPDPKTPLSDRSTLVKIAEYMAMAKPVVSYDLTESRVTAQDAAAYAEPNDPESLADAIDALLDDPERRAEMGAVGRRRVEETLAWEHSTSPLLAAYRHALGNTS